MSAPRIPRGGTRGTIYREIGRLRLKDAAALLRAKRYNGSVYLAGYAIECHLKFAYCKRRATIYLPANLETHDWETLVIAAGLVAEINVQPNIAALYSALLDQWGPSLRYSSANYGLRKAERLLQLLGGVL